MRVFLLMALMAVFATSQAVTMVIITKHQGNKITIERGVINQLSVGPITTLDYTTDEIFKDGFDHF